MRADIAEVIDRLRRSRSTRMLRLIDDAGLDRAAPVADPDVVEPYRWLLTRVGDGLRLTKAGYLPPAVVLDAMQTFGWDAEWIGKHNREDLTIPVLELRETARRLGLLRTQRGMLLRTVPGRAVTDDPAGLWWHVAGRLPDGRGEPERHAGLLFLLTVAAGRLESDELVAEGLTVLGWRAGDTRRPPDAHLASALARDTWSVYQRLGLLGRRRFGEPPAAPSPAAVHLARAALQGREGAPRAAEPVSAAVGTSIELTVTLRDIHPPIWRRIVVPATLSLDELHAVLQTALGWDDYHLHLFDVGGVLYGDVEDFGGDLGDEDTFTVTDAAAVAGTFRYDYDFGDGWSHDVQVGGRLQSVGAGTPHCLGGARACPPEDCGGVPGYQHLLEVLADPADDEHAEMLQWVGGGFDAEAFDVVATNELLALYDRHTRQYRSGGDGQR